MSKDIDPFFVPLKVHGMYVSAEMRLDPPFVKGKRVAGNYRSGSSLFMSCARQSTGTGNAVPGLFHVGRAIPPEHNTSARSNLQCH